jgi:hypothetical protein
MGRMMDKKKEFLSLFTFFKNRNKLWRIDGKSDRFALRKLLYLLPILKITQKHEI